MNLPDIQKCTPAEYQYYREERSERLDIIKDNLYVAMFCSYSMREVVKCGVKVYDVRDEIDSRYIVGIEIPRIEGVLPIIFTVDNLLNSYIETGGRLKLEREPVNEGFLRQPGKEYDLCQNFHSDAQQLGLDESSVDLETLIMA